MLLKYILKLVSQKQELKNKEVKVNSCTSENVFIVPLSLINSSLDLKLYIPNYFLLKFEHITPVLTFIFAHKNSVTGDLIFRL